MPRDRSRTDPPLRRTQRPRPRGARAAAATTTALALAAGALTALGTTAQAAEHCPARPAAGASACGTGGLTTAANPYAGADLYVDPAWSARAQDGGAPAEVLDQGTAVWLDSIESIHSGRADSGMGLADHLDEALVQLQSAPTGELVVQLVLYDLPGRDCAALTSEGELAPDEIDRYEHEFIDPIAEILALPQYADLRIAAVIEPFSLAYLPAHTSPRPGATAACDEALAGGHYHRGIAYAAAALADAGVHNYLDAGGHHVLGGAGAPGLFDDGAAMYGALLQFGLDAEDVHGIAADTADYGALEEPFFDVDDVLPGGPVSAVPWIDGNGYVDERAFALAFRDRLVQEGFAHDLGVVVDTSRNGWGGPDRPTETSGSDDPETYVDESRVDRRDDKGHRCNQAGAGLGERPQAAPGADPDLHAYAWIQPPGVSDGPGADEGKGFDERCTPAFGALPDGPPPGEWFQAHFEQLLSNAWPPL